MPPVETRLTRPDSDIVEPESKPQPAPNPDQTPQFNQFLRFPAPAIASSPDSLRQFYRGSVPQARVLPLVPPTIQSSLGGPAGKDGAPGKNGQPGAPGAPGIFSNRRIKIPLLISGNTPITGTVPLGLTFELLQVLVPQPMRIRLYSSTAARTADISRPIGTDPTLYAENGLIFDLVLDSTYSFPVLWDCSPNAIGSDLNTYPDGSIAYTLDIL